MLTFLEKDNEIVKEFYLEKVISSIRHRISYNLQLLLATIKFLDSYIKGIVHLNIIFSYMTFNEICNLDHSVY